MALFSACGRTIPDIFNSPINHLEGLRHTHPHKHSALESKRLLWWGACSMMGHAPDNGDCERRAKRVRASRALC